MGWTVLYIAFGIVALWLLGEVLLQYKARLRWRLLAFAGFVGVVAGVVLSSVVVIAAGAVAFAVGQTYVTLSFRRGFSAGWALPYGPAADRRPAAGVRTEPALEVSGLEAVPPDEPPAGPPPFPEQFSDPFSAAEQPAGPPGDLTGQPADLPGDHAEQPSFAPAGQPTGLSDQPGDESAGLSDQPADQSGYHPEQPPFEPAGPPTYHPEPLPDETGGYGIYDDSSYAPYTAAASEEQADYHGYGGYENYGGYATHEAQDGYATQDAQDGGQGIGQEAYADAGQYGYGADGYPAYADPYGTVQQPAYEQYDHYQQPYDPYAHQQYSPGADPYAADPGYPVQQPQYGPGATLAEGVWVPPQRDGDPATEPDQQHYPYPYPPDGGEQYG
jgi:hypothetical protein